MELAGDKVIAAPPEKVWAALIDPEFLRTLIPGCEMMKGSLETGYDIVVARSVGSLKAQLTGRFDVSEVEPERGCLLTGKGRGGAAGGASGTARIRLEPEGQGTRLSWRILAELDGKLASLPAFVVTIAARKVADGFVERFTAAIEGREPGRKSWVSRIAGG